MIEIQKNLFEKIANMKSAGKKLLAVGTTVCRTLESLPYLWKVLQQEEGMDFSVQTRCYWDTLCKDLPEEDYIDSIEQDDENTTLLFSTEIYIYPGKKFLLVDDLITNFHLPESTLLMLVSAFVGYEPLLSLYKMAIEHQYRFFSF